MCARVPAHPNIVLTQWVGMHVHFVVVSIPPHSRAVTSELTNGELDLAHMIIIVLWSGVCGGSFREM